MPSVQSSAPRNNKTLAGREIVSSRWLMMAPSLVFLGIIAVVALALIAIPDEVNRRSQYEAETYRAMSNGDFARARNCLESLIQISEENPRPEYLYQLALLSQQMGDGERAFRLLERLTIPGKSSYAPAHLNLANAYLSQNPQTITSLAEAQRHIEALLELDKNSMEYVQLKARWQLLSKRPDDALKTYESVLAQNASFAIPMAQILFEQKRDEEANRYLTASRSRIQAALDADYENRQARMRLADVDLMLKNYEQSARTLQNGMALGDESNQFRQALCLVLAKWSDSLGVSIEDLNKRMKLTIDGLTLDPTNPYLLDQFWKLTIKDLGKDPNQILRLRVLGANIAVLDAMAALQNLHNGKKEDARIQLAAVLKRSPDLAVLLNNLSTIGELQNKDKSTFSIDLLTMMHEILPDNKNILENRGMIYVRQAKYAEGLKDLEIALPGSSNKVAIHMALSESYDKLGNKEKADEHRKIAERLANPNRKLKDAETKENVPAE
jgi:tetratricopeptide (TPR) repeat protein